MMLVLGSSRLAGNSRGFSLPEMMMHVLLTAIVMGGVLSIFMRQSQHFRRQQSVTDTRETLRGALTVLSNDIRHASASRGDVADLQPQSFTIRSVVGAGDVCGIHASKERYALWEPVGDFEKLDKDSALVYNGAVGWVALEYKDVWEDPAAADVPVCEWPGAPPPGIVVEVKKAGSGGHVGSSVWHFRSVDYGLVERDGSWWLAQRVNSDDDNKWELLTGPLLAPSAKGLWIRYFDASGAETTDPAEVQRFEITLRAESQGASARRDSVITNIFLRN